MIKSISIKFSSPQDRAKAINKLNKTVFPALQKKLPLGGLNILELLDDGLMLVFEFTQSSIELGEDELGQLVLRALFVQGISIEQDQLIERSHQVISTSH